MFDDQGKRYIEGLAGLWSVAVGFGEKRLVEAATKQMRKLPYYHTFAHKSHKPSIDARREAGRRWRPRRPDACLLHQFGLRGQRHGRQDGLVLQQCARPSGEEEVRRAHRGYHGITIASGSLTGLPKNHRDFDLPAIAGAAHLTCPHYYRFGLTARPRSTSPAGWPTELEDDDRREEGADTIAAFIGEPLMSLAASSCRRPTATGRRSRRSAASNDILVVADEVINGFGRSARPSPASYYGIKPDLLTLSKQITSSYQPLAAVLISDADLPGVADNSGKIGTFGHGFTASGHPVATAVALENLNIIEERELVENAAAMGRSSSRRAWPGSPAIRWSARSRGVGLIAGVELVADKATKARFARAGQGRRLRLRAGHHHGLIVRNIVGQRSPSARR